jgi:transaldolase
MDNPLLKLEALGQSIWMDFIRRSTLTSGDLKRLIDEDGLSGVTSNPSIFEKAIAQGTEYDDEIGSLARQGKPVKMIYEALTIEDIRMTADIFRPVYDRLEGRDGFVSLEVSPHLAHDTVGTLVEARHLWQEVNRPNLFIKVPATKEGLPAIQQLIAEGINVNITLLFGLPRYGQVVEAYLAGLEALFRQRKALDRVASVASFFLSRIDVLLDPVLEKLMQEKGPWAALAAELHGQSAIASAKVAYQNFQEIFAGPRFRSLARQGARAQRLLWASTSTKNPAYSDVKYIEPLIGPETINTLPLETIDAYRTHGQPASRLSEGAEEARRTLADLAKAGIALDQSTQQLEDEGVKKFNDAYDQLMAVLSEKSKVVEHSHR